MSWIKTRGLVVLHGTALAFAASCWFACGQSSEDDRAQPVIPFPVIDGGGTDGASAADSASPSDSAPGTDSSSGPTVVYRNDFVLDTAGFDATLTETLPKDADGGVSKYLGQRPSSMTACSNARCVPSHAKTCAANASPCKRCAAR